MCNKTKKNWIFFLKSTEQFKKTILFYKLLLLISFYLWSHNQYDFKNELSQNLLKRFTVQGFETSCQVSYLHQLYAKGCIRLKRAANINHPCLLYKWRQFQNCLDRCLYTHHNVSSKILTIGKSLGSEFGMTRKLAYRTNP